MTMTCVITNGRPRVIKRVTWRKGHNTLPTSGRYQLSDNGKVVTIRSPSHTLDDGNYTCAGTNDVGTGNFSTPFHLQVNCKSSPILSEISMKLLTLTLSWMLCKQFAFYFVYANETQHKDGPLSDKDIVRHSQNSL